jgi:hypothetical protein
MNTILSRRLTLKDNFAGRMLIDDARRLTVDAVRLRDAAELIRYLDRQVQDPDSRSVIRLLQEMGGRYEEMARRLKLVALELEKPSPQGHVSKLDEVLAAYLQERTATRDAVGDGA